MELPIVGVCLDNAKCVVGEAEPIPAVKSVSNPCPTNVCGNACIKPAHIFVNSVLPNALPAPPLVPATSVPLVSSQPASAKDNSWTSLFESLPKNAGTFSPRSFTTLDDDSVMVAPSEVIQAGVEYWTGYLVGFFWDSTPPYKDVHDLCNRVWKFRGRLCVQYVDTIYFLKFSNSDDRLHVLEADPIIIEGKPFIITP